MGVDVRQSLVDASRFTNGICDLASEQDTSAQPSGRGSGRLASPLQETGRDLGQHIDVAGCRDPYEVAVAESD